MAHDPVNHVLDTRVWPILEAWNWEIPLPAIYIPGLDRIPGHEDSMFHITKYMVLELLAAVLIALIFIPLCRLARSGQPPKGPFWNAFESLLTFIRNEVARPNLGEHDADTYVPLLWTMFIFILFCNLLGMIPLLGSPTASIYATLGMALISLVMMHGAAIAKMGPIHYVQSLWPHIDMPFFFGIGYLLGLVISLMIFVIEFAGTFIKSAVLAARLFFNMFVGHVVLISILLLIVMAGEGGQVFSFGWSMTTVISVLGVVALSLLELFVAFLQAYVFVFLTALFMGMALHPSH